jgi:hypothetical protein
MCGCVGIALTTGLGGRAVGRSPSGRDDVGGGGTSAAGIERLEGRSGGFTPAKEADGREPEGRDGGPRDDDDGGDCGASTADGLEARAVGIATRSIDAIDGGASSSARESRTAALDA